VIEEAAELLATSVAAAADSVGETTVTAVGGLSQIGRLIDLWSRAVPDRLDVVPAKGTSLDGAVLLARRHDLPHEARVVRSQPGRSGEVPTPDQGSEPPQRADVDLLSTEQVRSDVADLDQRTPQQLVDVLLQAEAEVPEAVRASRTEIASAVSLVEEAFAAGGRLVYVGAGTPGRLAALDAAECPPTFGTAPDRVVALLAGGDDAASSAVEGAEDDAEAGARDVRAAEVTRRDVVIGISASGRTPYVLAALEEARASGAATVAIVNNPGSQASTVADVTIELDTGPEVLSGSTRLKSGTAQKVVLNTISTSAMVRTGKSYGGWMVDVQATNEKLRWRARRIVREAAAVDDAIALRTLEAAGWSTKTALVALLADVDVDEAQRRLDEVGGRVRVAVDAARVVDAP
jgi:N-acetylmuramic acid 6-phosphate etherase